MPRSMITWKITVARMKDRAPCGIRMAFRLAAGLPLLTAASPSAAVAHGFISFHFGVPLVVGPPAYYVPPPVYYAPPPFVYTPPPPPQTCHEYRTTATIGGTPRPVVGTACLQPDGTWRVTQ